MDPDYELPLSMREQGVRMQCIFCNDLYPELKLKGCPHCQGRGEIFQPARMMDRTTSQRELSRILSEFFRFISEKTSNSTNLEGISKLDKKDIKEIRDRAIGILSKVVIYGFDLKTTLIDLIHELDEAANLRK